MNYRLWIQSEGLESDTFICDGIRYECKEMSGALHKSWKVLVNYRIKHKLDDKTYVDIFENYRRKYKLYDKFQFFVSDENEVFIQSAFVDDNTTSHPKQTKFLFLCNDTDLDHIQENLKECADILKKEISTSDFDSFPDILEDQLMRRNRRLESKKQICKWGGCGGLLALLVYATFLFTNKPIIYWYGDCEEKAIDKYLEDSGSKAGNLSRLARIDEKINKKQNDKVYFFVDAGRLADDNYKVKIVNDINLFLEVNPNSIDCIWSVNTKSTTIEELTTLFKNIKVKDIQDKN